MTEIMQDGDYYQFHPSDLDHGQVKLYCHDIGDGPEVFANFDDSMRFHIDRARLAGHSMPVDHDGWLTEGGGRAVRRVLNRHFPVVVGNVMVGDDEPGYTVSTYVGSELTENEAIDKAWPFIAHMLNATDPGTFNHYYLFDDLTEGLER